MEDRQFRVSGRWLDSFSRSFCLVLTLWALQQCCQPGLSFLRRLKSSGEDKLTLQPTQMLKTQVKLLIDKIYAIPDGMGGNRRPFKVRHQMVPAWMLLHGLHQYRTVASSAQPAQLCSQPSRFSSSTLTAPRPQIGSFPGSGSPQGSAVNLSNIPSPIGIEANPAYYRSTEETAQFEQEWEASKKRQDSQLDKLEAGLGGLADMARGMQEEIDRQAPIIDDADRQLGSVTSKLKSNNAKIKGMVLQVRSRAGRRSNCPCASPINRSLLESSNHPTEPLPARRTPPPAINPTRSAAAATFALTLSCSASSWGSRPT
jgi:hypothetical protein